MIIVKLLLKSSGQVMLQNHLMTGCLFLIALFLDSVKTGSFAVLGVLCSLMTAFFFRKKTDAFLQGIFGYNGLLIGCMAPIFVRDVPIIYVVGGSIVGTLFQLMVERFFTKLPLLTTPFVLISWITVLFNPILKVPFPEMTLTEYFFQNISQVFLVGNTLSGVLILAGIFVSSLVGGFWVTLASVIAILFSKLTNTPTWGFSAVLVPLALLIFPPKRAHTLLMVAGIFLSVILQTTLGPAAFTAPFILSVWAILLVSKFLTGKRFFQNQGT